VLALVDLADPGNLGTLVRAAEAAGGAGVVVSGTTTDPFGPKAVRAAAGSLMRLPVAEVGDPIEMVEAIRRCGRLVVATVAAGGSAPDSLDLTGPLALVVGSEAHGLSDALIARCDTTSTIPLAASVESLNAAVAGSIVLFEVARQRRRAELRPGGDRSPRTDWTPDSPTDRLDDR
jgi:TrmH family RNA methyltransferase